MRVLISGVGNALKGDDAFGVRSVQAMGQFDLPDGVTLIETGIGGIHMVQELMRGYDVLILFDAHDRGDEPGRLRVVEPQLPDIASLSEEERRAFFADMHYATPVRALTLAREIGALPAIVRIIGCQPADADAFGTEMCETVAASIPRALDLALELITQLRDVMSKA